MSWFPSQAAQYILVSLSALRIQPYLSILWLWVGVASLLGTPQVVRGAGTLVLLVVARILPPACTCAPLHPLLRGARQHRLSEHRHVSQGLELFFTHVLLTTAEVVSVISAAREWHA